MAGHSDMSEKGESSNDHVVNERPSEDENESRYSSDNLVGGASADEQNSQRGISSKKRKYIRHSANQVQELEAAFTENPHPDENTREELAKKLGMDSKQVKVWYQNRRAQMKKQMMAGDSDMSEKGESSNHVVNGRPSEDESESRYSGDKLVGGASGDEQDSARGTSSKKRKRIKHTANQVLELEAAFKENPRPDDKTREELAKKLGMDSKQVKFWYQNRRTHMKSQSEKHESGMLKQQNDQLRVKQVTLKKAMSNPVCNRCGSQASLAKINDDERQAKIEHEQLKYEVKRITLLAEKLSVPFVSLEGSMHSAMENSAVGIGGFGGINSVETQQPMEFDLNKDPPSPLPVTPPQPTPSLDNVDVSYDKSKLMDLAVAAMNELLKLAEIGEPLWVKSLDGGGETLSLEEYVPAFTPCTGMKPGYFTTEATKASAIVIINSLTLVETLMDSRRWVEMFSCMVGKTSADDVISSSSVGSWSGTLQLIQTEFQILSDMVPVRKVKFLRFCKQHAEGLWAVVDVSADSVQEGSQPDEIGNCRRLPSGCVIQDMPNGHSKVTWIEHMEYNESVVNHLYRPLIRIGLGFGAQRWMATLQRISEFMAVMMSPVDTTGDQAVVCSSGRRSIAMLAQRMARSFCGGVCATIHKWDPIQVANGEDAKLMVRKNIGDPGELTGVILTATNTFWLPVKQHRLIEFLLNKEKRSQWDFLTNSDTLQQMAYIAKGQNPDNSISLFRANTSQEDDTNADQNSKLILQDTSSDATGFLLVYATVDTSVMKVVMDGGDSSSVAFLPSGISIVPDCFQDFSAATNSTGTSHGFSCTGSLVTIGFQILANSLPTAKLTSKSVKKVNDLVARTIKGIKASFKCE